MLPQAEFGLLSETCKTLIKNPVGACNFTVVGGFSLASLGGGSFLSPGVATSWSKLDGIIGRILDLGQFDILPH